MRILVTGGAGFIGSNVVDRFVAEGHDVAVFDDLSSGFREFVHPKAKLYVGDLADAAAVDAAIADFRPEVVDHHAAQIDVRKSVSDPVWDARVNVLGSIGLLQALAAQGLGIVGLSENFARTAVEQGALERVLPGWELPPTTIWCVTAGRRLLPRRTTAFIEILRAALTGEAAGRCP